MVRRGSSFLLLVFCLLTVGCDHLSKNVATALLVDRPPVPVIPGLFELRYMENRDLAFSFLQSFDHEYKALALSVVALTALVLVLVVWWRRRHASLVEQTGFALIVGGAIGNCLDRLGNGYVVDFLHVRWWPIFNVADVAVVVGVGLLLLTSRGAPARTGRAPAR